MEPQEPIERPEEQEVEPTPPQPIQTKRGWSIGSMTLGLLVATGGTILMLMSATAGATRGATRHCKLKWQEREREVAEAILSENAAVIDQQSNENTRSENPSKH